MVLYAAFVSPLSDERLFERAYFAVGETRRRRVDTLILPQDKRLSLGAALLLKKALRDYGVRRDDIAADENGKPFLLSGEAQFNLSHSGNFALCAVADCEVGCDAEKIRDVEPDVAKRFFTDGEYAAISAAQSPEGKRELFFRLWTLKESFIKAAGAGLSVPLRSFEIELGEKISARRDGEPIDCGFLEFGDVEGYRYALCTAEKDVQVSVKIFDLSEESVWN